MAAVSKKRVWAKDKLPGYMNGASHSDEEEDADYVPTPRGAKKVEIQQEPAPADVPLDAPTAATPGVKSKLPPTIAHKSMSKYAIHTGKTPTNKTPSKIPTSKTPNSGK